MPDRPVDQVIAGIARRRSVEPFIPTRYPFTYAADYFRSYPADFGHDPADPRLGSRGSAPIREYAARTGQDPVEVIIALADAYLDEWHIGVTDSQKGQALDYQRVTAWKAMGLPEPQIKPGMRFEHATMRDTTAWTPGPGQSYADAPKQIMVVIDTTGYLVRYSRDGSAAHQWGTPVVALSEVVGRWLPPTSETSE